MGSGYRVFTAGEVLSASNVQNYLQDQAVMVFGGTAARSSAIGTANFEEGMLTYLTDVDKLQVYTGAAFADVYPAAATNQGLTLISTTSFSGVSSQSFNNVFSATYTNYTIRSYFSAFSAADEFGQLRFRNAGADNSTANYDLERLRQESTTVSGARTTGATSLNCFDFGSASGTRNQTIIDIIGPFAAAPTVVFTHDVYVSPVPSVKQGIRTGLQTQSTSFDGFTIFPASGTMTGTISVYGWNS